MTHTAVSMVVKDGRVWSLSTVKMPLPLVDCCKFLLNKLKFRPHGQIIFFSNEKTFTVESYINIQNNSWVRLGDPKVTKEAGDQDADHYATAM